MKVTDEFLISRMKRYFAAKARHRDVIRINRAQATCRLWLLWVGWYSLSHKQRHQLHLKIKA